MVFETTLRVRFSDTDMYGHVNNARYATFAEETRIAFLADVLGELSMPLILASASYKYLHQTRFPAHRDLKSRMWVTNLGNSSVELRTQILTLDGILVCDSLVTVVHFDYQSQRAARLPAEVRELLRRYYYEKDVVPYD